MEFRHGLFLFAAVACPGALAAQAEPPADEPLPPGFRGEIVYSGTYQGEVTTKAERMRVPGIAEAVRSLASSRTLPLAGEYALTLRFEGNMVQGSARFHGAAETEDVPLELGSFTGLRSGEDCTIQWGAGPAVVALCSRGEFVYGFAEFEDRQGDEITISVIAGASRFVDFRQREYQRVAQRVLQVASFDDRVMALRASYDGDGVLPALKCYRMRQEVGLHDGQLADLEWLAGNYDEIAADVRSSGDAIAVEALASLSPQQIGLRISATHEARAAAETEYDTSCPKA